MTVTNCFVGNGNGITDNAAALQASIDTASAAGGGVIVFPQPAVSYAIASTITLKTNVVLFLGTATLKWTGAVDGMMFSSSTSTTLNYSGISGGFLDFSKATGAGICLNVLSAYRCLFDTVITGASVTSTILNVSVNTSGENNPAGNRNAVYSTYRILVTGTCGTCVKTSGDATRPTVVTLNDFNNISADSVAVRGVNFVNWTDTNQFSGITRFSITANNGVGVEYNTGTPASNVGVYENNFQNLAVDTFGTKTGRVGVKMNNTKNNVIDFYVNSPAAESGSFVTTSNTGSYKVTIQPAGTNELQTLSFQGNVNFYAQISTNQTFTGAKTKVDFGTSNYSPGRGYDSSTSTFTAPYDGNYFFTCSLSNTTGFTVGDVWKLTMERAGSVAQAIGSTAYVPADVTGAVPLRLSGYFKLAAGDTVICYMTRVSGAGNYVEINDATFCFFEGYALP